MHPSDNRLVARSLGSVRSLIGLQLVSRLVTFVLNQGLVRLASPQVYGTVSVQFELITSTVLFLSREGVRNSLLRLWPQQSNVHTTLAQCANLATLPFVLSLPTTAITVALYAYSTSENTRSQPHFYWALFIYAISALVELLSEPMHNRAMGQVRTDVRVRAEGFGVILKTVTTYLILFYDSKSRKPGKLALIAFALGQLAYSATIFGVYESQFPESNLWPVRLPKLHAASKINKAGSWYLLVLEFFDPDALHLSMTMTSQSVVKHFLTEGDKLLVSYWSPLQDQGGYAIAVNYGSLIARIVFQPIEEMCRVYFSKVLSSTTGEPSKAALDHASSVIASLLLAQIALSSLVITFGSLYLPIVLQLLLPKRYLYTSAPKVLSAWVYYIPVLALNGGLEAFYSSIATPQDLRAQSRWMLVFSMIYILSAIVLYKLGFADTSLVYANIVNLAARIWYTASFIATYFEKRTRSHQFKILNVIPGWKFLGMVMLSFLVISRNDTRERLGEGVDRGVLLSASILTHVALGGILGLVCGGMWWLTEGRALIDRNRTKIE